MRLCKKETGKKRTNQMQVKPLSSSQKDFKKLN
jgi:hypothetical protein